MLKGFLTTNQGKTKLSIISFVILFLTFSLFLAGGVFSQDNYDAPEEGECNFTINESMVESFEGKVLINGTILGVSQGDLVCIEQGNYSANIIVDIENVTMASLGGPENTNITSGNQGNIQGDILAAFVVTANNVTIKGFTIQNGFLGILGMDVENLSIQDNYIKNIEAGVLLLDSDVKSGMSEILGNNVFEENIIKYGDMHKGNSTIKFGPVNPYLNNSLLRIFGNFSKVFGNFSKGSGIQESIGDSDRIEVLEDWNISFLGVNITIPKDTVITSKKIDGSYANFSIFNLTASNLNVSNLNNSKNITFNSAIEFGIPEIGLNFTKSIKIKLNLSDIVNKTGNFSIFKSHNKSGPWNQSGLVNLSCEVSENDSICEFWTTEASYFALGNFSEEDGEDEGDEESGDNITININQLSDVYTVNETLQNSINSAPDVTPIEVSLSGDYEGNVRINPVEVEGEGDVQLWAKDSEGNWYNIVESGWGPVDTGFSINESAVTDVYPLGNEGTYTINISVVAINGTEAREILVSENRNVSFGIQSAIDNANSGDVVQVSSGTYEESVKITKPITVESIAGPEETIIDATGKGRAFQIQTNDVSGSNIIIEGFNITGNKTISTGITIREGQSSVKETNFVIKNNHFYNLAAGINAWGFGAYNNSWKNRVESIKIKNNKFTNLGEQEVQNGGAILLETLGNQNRTGGDYAAIIENNSFDNIFSLNSEAPGAGVVLQWKVFIGNETELNDSAANAKVVGNDFGNVALDVAVGGNTTNTLIRENNFGDGGIGVMTKNIGMGSVDATHNYWGHPSGPNRTVSDNASNDSNWIGQGDRVGENVSYVPWYPTENLIVLIDDNKPGRGNIENKREIKRENISVEFEGNTSLKGNDNWNGIFYIIEKDNVSEEGTAPSFSGKNTHIGKVIEIGSNTTQLNFSKPVKIVIYGEAGKDVGWTRAGEDFNKIEECSKNFDNATEANESLENFDECKIDINNSLIIWTTHFTEFVTYETSPTETSSGGSGSSGGGGMGICATEWNCTDWSECVNGTQTRNCSYPEGFCEPTEEKPEENRTCSQPEEDDGVGGEEKETEEDFEKNQTDLVDEPTTQTSGFITGFVTGIKKGNTKDISVLVIILAVLGLIIYYRSSTIAGLSKRAEKLHKKADKLNKKGEHNRASRVRNKARDFQVRADKKSY